MTVTDVLAAADRQRARQLNELKIAAEEASWALRHMAEALRILTESLREAIDAARRKPAPSLNDLIERDQASPEGRKA